MPCLGWAAEAPASKSAPQTPETYASTDKIKAVPRKPLLKGRRVELSPMLSLSMNDALYEHFAVSVQAIVYPHDSFGIGLGVDYLFANVATHHIKDVRIGMASVPADEAMPRLFGHVDGYWVPLNGKFGVFDKAIVYFDTYLSMGVGVASALQGRSVPAANVAIGQRYQVTDWLTVRVEVRDHIFVDRLTVHDQQRSDIQNYVMLNLGVSFFLPPTFEYSLR